MIIHPTPFLGFNSVYKGPARFIGLRRRVDPVGDHYVAAMDFSIFPQEKFLPRSVKGDLAGYTRSGVGYMGAPFVQRVKLVGNFLWMCVRLVDVGNVISQNTRAFLFRSPAGEGETWTLVPTGIEGSVGGVRHMVDIAGNGSYIVALASSGHRAVSTDGGLTFTPYDGIGFTGTDPALSIEGTSAGFVAGGTGGQMRYAADPRGSWSAAVSQFGSDPIEHITAGNRLVAVGANRIATAELNNLATWTARTSPLSSGNNYTNFVKYLGSRWFAGGGSNVFVTSVDGMSWTNPADKPQTAFGVSGILHDITYGDDYWYALGNGQRLAKWDGANPWQNIPDAGLTVVGLNYLVRAAAA